MTAEENTDCQSDSRGGFLIGLLLIIFLVAPHIIWISSGKFPTEFEQGLYFIYLSGIFLASYFFEQCCMSRCCNVAIYKSIFWVRNMSCASNQSLHMDGSFVAAHEFNR
jgi:hypothetical protein